MPMRGAKEAMTLAWRLVMRCAAALLTLAPSMAGGQELSAKSFVQDAAAVQRSRSPLGAAPLSTSVRAAFLEFASGRPRQAYQQALRILQTRHSADLGGAHWVAGLSAWRLEKFDEAAAHFAARAASKSTTPHERAASAFWLARSYLYARKPELVDIWLGRAAMHDGTFYGAIAARQLAKASTPASMPALHFPKLSPSGGWRLDRALMFAIMRQESAFDGTAVSSAGAVGLMQVLPDTAAALSGDARYRGDGYRLLFEPGTNIALGQRYMELMLGPEHFRGNIILAIAAYNAGPRSVAAWSYRDDPLSFIEAIPFEETRQYVPKVLANLWLYQRRQGRPVTSLDALASNEWPIYEADSPGERGSAEASYNKRAARYRGR
jgi:soluble lytic murein transglycosylase-like protein